MSDQQPQPAPAPSPGFTVNTSNLNGILNFLESVGAIAATVLAIVSAVQHNLNPIVGTSGKLALTTAISAFGLHHGQSHK